MPPMDFDRSPFLVIWETTQACDLACQHCRASAQPCRHPDELSTEDAKSMLERIREFGPVIFVFSGGDAFTRPDIVELTRYGAGLGLYLVHGLTRAHGGTVTIGDAEGGGARIRIDWPAVQPI